MGRFAETIQKVKADGGALVLDGGLATELEAAGIDLRHPLWSARLLDSQPDAIRRVHRSYLQAGADCIIAASYQASLEGLAACGYDPLQSRQLLVSAVELARQERDAFAGRGVWVAASIGPYGAYLADGSEFTGRYGLSVEQLANFHRERLELLWQAGPDLLAIETLPSLVELRALLQILRDLPDARAWISFSCCDGEHIHDGTPIRQCAALCADAQGVVAIGVNCTAPEFVGSLISELLAGAPGLPIVVYPNSGETYDGELRAWTGESNPTDYGRQALKWRDQGASMIGGCCRTGPQHIREIRQALKAADD